MLTKQQTVPDRKTVRLGHSAPASTRCQILVSSLYFDAAFCISSWLLECPYGGASSQVMSACDVVLSLQMLAFGLTSSLLHRNDVTASQAMSGSDAYKGVLRVRQQDNRIRLGHTALAHTTAE